ncbi:MAG: S8 family serine peptidase [Alkaliphilus sp.]
MVRTMDSCVKIIVVDSGISVFQKEESNTQAFFYERGQLTDSYEDNIGHGTAVYYILDRYADADITSMKLFENEEMEVDEDDLIGLLSYINENMDFDILHLSMGLTYCERKSDLKEVCDRITRKGKCIVSAFSNEGLISYPAAFLNVIGVDISRMCKRIKDYEFVESSIVNIRAISAQQNLPWLRGAYKMVSGSSFAAPHITAKIAQLMKRGIKKSEEVLDALKKDAVKVYVKQPYIMQEKMQFAERVVIFPFNKEIHSILRYQHLLRFQIDQVLDLKYMRTIYKKVSEMMDAELVKDFTIQNLDALDWSSSFDTFIMGHVREINEVTNKDYRLKILQNCLKHGKNICSFDTLEDYTHLAKKMRESGLKVYNPEIKSIHVPKNRFGKLKAITAPVLGVFGTSSRQGKFTLQLKLRELFLKKGYMVGQLGTEPSSPLFGMDFVYPMGYDALVNVTEQEAITVLNDLISRIDDASPDIILVGAQSHTVPYAVYHLSLLPLTQHSFLLGSSPDATILCINIYDDIDYIKRSINYLESAVPSSVIGVVLSPVIRTLDYSNLSRRTDLVEADELNNQRNWLSQHLKREIYILNEEKEIDSLVDACILFFLQEG